MCDTTLAFGENEGYHFECPSRWSQGKLPGDLNFLFKEKVVSTSYSMALGPNGSFVFSYRANTGKVRITSMNIPEGLKTWLYTKDAAGKLVRNFENLSVSLGPDGKAFWAMDGKNFIWNSLPNDLSIGVAGLLKNGTFTDSPRLVTLGVGGDYFMLTKNDACYWRLTNYRELNAVMPTFQNNKAFHTIRNLVLSPHAAQVCAAVLSSGTSFAEGMPATAQAEMQAMEKAIKSDTEILQRRQEQQRIEENNRAIKLTQMATALADAQTRRNMQAADFMNNIGYECRYCRRNPAYCNCGGYVI